MDKYLAYPDLSPSMEGIIANLTFLPPVGFLVLPPVMEAKHDGEGAGGQHLLIVIVVQAVGCRQGKSVANLRGKVFNSL